MNSIASKVFEEQKKMKIGLYQEARSFLAILNIKESDMKERNKRQWAKLVRECLKEKNRTDLLHRAKEYSKIDYIQMKEEDFELKNYFKEMTIKDCRTKFSLFSQTTMTVKSNCMSDKEYAKDLWKCPEPECIFIDSFGT